MRVLLSLCAIVLLAACNPDKQKEVDQTTISFDTNDASKLFFKNMRQSYYDQQIMEEAKLELYRFSKRNTDNETPVINLTIVNNWRYDQAYLLLEPGAGMSLSDLKISWTNSELGESGEIVFENGNKETIVRFADQIYYQLQRGSQFKVMLEDGEVDILKTSQDREAFRITMVDYYRLVQRL